MPVAGARPPKRNQLRLTDRDRQLMGMLATVRYLSMDQLRRLVFAERNGINLHKRLLALAGEGRHAVPSPYLKKLSYRNWEGMPQTAWALTGLGFTVAESVLPAPPRRPSAETGANFIDHGLMLNELYVQLLERPLKQQLAAARATAEREKRPSRSFTKVKAGLYARAAQLGFRWHSHDEVRLPWNEYVLKEGRKRDRIIIPDATIEVPGQVIIRDRQGEERKYPGRRIFVEAETGSQTIEPEGDTKPGATTNKLSRYAAYLTDYAGSLADGDRTTWYSKAYPDGYQPTLLFLVRTPSRAAAVDSVLEERRRNPNVRQIRAEVLNIEAAAAALLPMGGTVAALAGGYSPRFSLAEAELLREYYKETCLLMKSCRDDARRRGAAPPEYPKQSDEVCNLVNDLVARARR